MMRFALSLFVLTLLAPQAWALGASYQDVKGPKEKAEKNTKGLQDKQDKKRRGMANQSLSPSPQLSHSLARRLVRPSPASSGGTDRVSRGSECRPAHAKGVQSNRLVIAETRTGFPE